MKSYRLALIGFGNVGQGLTQILRDHGQKLAQQYGASFQIVAVCDFLQGSLYNPAGLDPALLLKAVENDGHLRNLAAPQQGWDALETITRCNADVVVEMSYTDLQTGEPATSHIRAALQAGKHVATTNKGPIALHYPELAALAEEHKVIIEAEGTGMSGSPAIHLGPAP